MKRSMVCSDTQGKGVRRHFLFCNSTVPSLNNFTLYDWKGIRQNDQLGVILCAQKDEVQSKQAHE